MKAPGEKTFFIVKEGQLITPSLSSSALEGIYKRCNNKKLEKIWILM